MSLVAAVDAVVAAVAIVALMVFAMPSVVVTGVRLALVFVLLALLVLRVLLVMHVLLAMVAVIVLLAGCVWFCLCSVWLLMVWLRLLWFSAAQLCVHSGAATTAHLDRAEKEGADPPDAPQAKVKDPTPETRNAARNPGRHRT